ncbi:MAG: DUF421 domain-containing protein [Clostridia bacterium]|nr:DUF421 domain-containing protein [Clostridia bacterium]
MIAIFIRTVIIYLLLICIMRFTGKRQIGELQISELITAFLLSNIASQPLTNANVPLLYAIVPITVILCLEIIFSFWTIKSAAAKSLLEGKPSIVIKNGVIDQREMAKIRMSVDDLICQLRLCDAASPEVVDYAIFEENGQLSVFQKENPPKITGVAHPVIIDGKCIKYALDELGKDEKWAKDAAKANGEKNINNIFLMTADDALKICITKKENT